MKRPQEVALRLSKSESTKRRARLVSIVESLPGAAAVGTQHLSLEVSGRRFGWFMESHHGDGRLDLNCRAQPGTSHSRQEIATGMIHFPKYVGKKGWIGLWLDTADPDWALVARCLEEAYCMTAPKRLVNELKVARKPPKTTRDVKRKPKVNQRSSSKSTTDSAACVAFIRGINVGRAKRVAMSDLRGIVEKLGYSDVRTLLNSGNIVFATNGTAPKDIAESIELALVEKLKVAARVTVLTATELSSLIRANPLIEVVTDPSRFVIAILRNPDDRAKLKSLSKESWNPEAFALGRRVAYLWCADGILESRLVERVGKILGEDVTTRNWTTINKLLALTSTSHD